MLPQQVLKYHDVQLYASDVALFAPGQWLNDNAINFYFQYLHQSFCLNSSSSSSDATSDVLLADPAVISCLTMQCDDDDEFRELGAGLQLARRRLFLLPVSDNEQLGGASSHWSLLVFRRDTGVFEHFDSSAGHNASAAVRVQRAFQKMMQVCCGDGDGDGASAPLVEVRDAPQQRNGFDCGMYVLVVAEWLCRQHAGAQLLPSLADFATAERVTRTRREMPALVRRLQVEQESGGS